MIASARASTHSDCLGCRWRRMPFTSTKSRRLCQRLAPHGSGTDPLELQLPTWPLAATTCRVRLSGRARQLLAQALRELLQPLQRLRLLAAVLLQPLLDVGAAERSPELDERLVARELEVLGVDRRGRVEEIRQARLSDLRRHLPVLRREGRGGRAARRRGLRVERAEALLDAGHVLVRLRQVLLDRGGKRLALHLLRELRQHLEHEHPLDPEHLRQELQEEIARAGQPIAHTRFAFRSPASRSESAMITSAGFAAPWVGKTLPSQTSRFGTSHALCDESTTESSGLEPIRQPPTRCA